MREEGTKHNQLVPETGSLKAAREKLAATIADEEQKTPLSDGSGEPSEATKDPKNDPTKYSGLTPKLRAKFSSSKGGPLLRYPYEAMDQTQDYIKFDVLCLRS